MNKGQFRVSERTQKDYTLAFKLQVVDEVERGDQARMLSITFAFIGWVL